MFDDETVIFAVVMNDEEQYSIWPEFKMLSRGWKAVGKTGTKAECLAHIRETWTDMRPASLRRRLAEASA
jgi:MbtH protein